MRVLVIAGRTDFHARVVSYALERRGHEVHLLASDDFACVDSVNIEASSNCVDASLDIGGKVIALGNVEVVWNRRPYEPIVLDNVAPEDQAFARKEISAAHRGICCLLDHARWVNPLDAIARAENKIYQLRCAIAVGLSIPNTLVSSNAQQIRAFLRKESDCIYKPLNGYVWLEQGRQRATYTATVGEDDLPPDTLLRAAPGIYQRRVEKAYEVRAQFFGRTCAAIRIDAADKMCVDWRLTQSGIKECDPVSVPTCVQARCLALMERLGIVCGAFDFMVQPDGRWIFLEVNQAGQFLFLEEWCPQLPVLEMFCGLLESPSLQFTYTPCVAPIRFADAAWSCLPSETPPMRA